MDRQLARCRKVLNGFMIALVAGCGFTFLSPGECDARTSLGARLWASGIGHPILLAREEQNSDDNGFQRNYRQWENLPPEEKNQLRNRMNQYKQMPPQHQQQYQQKFEQWKKLPPEDRRQIQQSLKGWNDLSPEEKDAIRRRFGNQ